MTNEELALKIRTALCLSEAQRDAVEDLVSELRREIELDVSEELDDLRDDTAVAKEAALRAQAVANQMRTLAGHEKAWRLGAVARNRSETTNPYSNSDARYAKWAEGWRYMDGAIQHLRRTEKV